MEEEIKCIKCKSDKVKVSMLHGEITHLECLDCGNKQGFVAYAKKK